MKNLMMQIAVVVIVLSFPATPFAAHGHTAADTGLVKSVIAGSAADAAGMRAGDRLIRLDGRRIANLNDLEKVKAAHRPGDTVPLTVERDGETVDLTLTFGETPDGGVLIGVMINLALEPEAGADAGVGTTECLAWIEGTYGINAMMRKLPIDPSQDYETMLNCVGRDTQRMSTDNAIKYCDNVFKVHCSGVDLLTEIGEAQVEQCEEQIGASLGIRPKQYRGWKTCAEQKVFERYAITGEASDAEQCQAALLDECGTNIDAAMRTGELSPEQWEFVECCSADSLDSEKSGKAARCEAIDDGFARGPCHDRPVCINRLTSEWLHCPVPE